MSLPPRIQRLLFPIIIGLLGLAAAAAIAAWGGVVVASLQVGVGDFLFVRAGGPRLGARPVDDNIALVLFDYSTAQQLGYVHSYEEDVEVYRKLLDAGAALVFDCRMVAAADPQGFEELRPMLDDMLAIDGGQGRLLRDVWLGSALEAETIERYASLQVQNVVNSHPHAVKSIESRLYPLAYFVSSGPQESAPLAIARRLRKQPRATSAEVGAELRRCGVLTVWHQLAPQLVPKTEEPKSPYILGEQAIEWLPFATATSLVPPAAFWVSYDPPADEYPRHSFVDVMSRASAEDFRGKCVIIGFDAEIDPTSDTYEIPNLPGKASAAHVVASATQTLLDDRTMKEMPRPWALAATGLLTLSLAFAGAWFRPLHAVAAAFGLLVLYFVFTVGAYRSGWYPDCVIAPVCGAGAATAGLVGNAWSSLRLRRRVMDLFGRYVPRAVVNQLMQRPELESLMLGGEVREVSVLFADVRGFTTYSQHLPPEEVVRELNALLEIMVACTFEHEGTLDKFIGDAILVLFNAPLDQPDHADRAVRTAVAIQQRLAGHGSGLRVGIGVHRGQAVVGNIGTPQRMEYTAIGSTVNIASRLCDYAKPGEVIVSAPVVAAVGDAFALEPLGGIQVKGISEPLEVARVTAPSPA